MLVARAPSATMMASYCALSMSGASEVIASSRHSTLASTALAVALLLLLRGCRGQNLVLRNGGGWQTPIISGKYVVPIDGGERLLAGATFEYDATTTALHRPADEAFAESELRAPLERLCPGIGDEELLSVQAGVRALPPRSHHGYVPIAGRLGGSSQRGAPSTECWLIGGLGSRGLIHHALIGRDLARAVLARDESLLPPHVRRAQDALDAARL